MSALGGPGRTERGVVLAGDAALAWFAAHGVRVVSADGRPVRLAADVLSDEHLTLLRIWHSPVVSSPREREAPSGRQGGYRMLIILDGSVMVISREERFSLSRDEWIVFAQGEAFEIISDAPSARLELEIGPIAALGPHVITGTQVRRVNPRVPTSTILSTLSTVVFSSGLSPHDPGWSHLARSIAEAMLAALAAVEQRPSSAVSSSAHKRLFHRAMDVIDAEYSNRDFSVQMLTSRLTTSATRLREAFAAHRTTARAQITLARAARAARALGEGRFTSREDLESIAAFSGFSSARAMAAAMKRLREQGHDLR